MVVIEMTWLLEENQKTEIWAKPKNAKGAILSHLDDCKHAWIKNKIKFSSNKFWSNLLG
jgi:hypothetical protein